MREALRGHARAALRGHAPHRETAGRTRRVACAVSGTERGFTGKRFRALFGRPCPVWFLLGTSVSCASARDPRFALLRNSLRLPQCSDTSSASPRAGGAGRGPCSPCWVGQPARGAGLGGAGSVFTGRRGLRAHCVPTACHQRNGSVFSATSARSHLRGRWSCLRETVVILEWGLVPYGVFLRWGN